MQCSLCQQTKARLVGAQIVDGNQNTKLGLGTMPASFMFGEFFYNKSDGVKNELLHREMISETMGANDRF